MRVRDALPQIDTARCTGCGRCVAACGLHLLCLAPVGWKKFSTLIDADRCNACAACSAACPFDAIAVRRVARPCIEVAVAEPLRGCDRSAWSGKPEAGRAGFLYRPRGKVPA
jgi:Fe-S-cluster-containing hydrogenase component 2